MKVRKIISYIIDAILLVLIGLFVYTQISMMVSVKDPKNHGVPKAFGASILCIVTNSMDDGTENCLSPETGIIIKETSVESLRKCNPISYSESTGKVTEYDKEGDIVTFYYEKLGAPDTHRVIDYVLNVDGSYTVYTLGDNPTIREKLKSSEGNQGYEEWNSEHLIGKVVFPSKALGKFLIISSPAVAASFGKSAWFFPVAMIIPIVIIAGTFALEEIIKYRKWKKERTAYINEALQNSGIDLNDEEAVELFKMKEELRYDMREEKEEMKAKIKKEIQRTKELEKKALEKEKARLRKEYEKGKK